jgi:serine/threonine-protein kinase ATR
VTGDAVHVDFNCLFNRGETFAVPELVPFRLTHNIVGAMGPTGYEGAFRKGCETTLRVVREHSDSFMSVLESFVYDPLLDHSAKKGGMSRTNSAGNDAASQTAATIVEEIRERIMGVLRAKKIANKLGSVTKTQQASKLPLSIEGQVNHVIQEATSIDNLCQMFRGWAPEM